MREGLQARGNEAHLEIRTDVHDLGSQRVFFGFDVIRLLLGICCLRAQRLCLRVDVHGVLEHGADFLFEKLCSVNALQHWAVSRSSSGFAVGLAHNSAIDHVDGVAAVRGEEGGRLSAQGRQG